MKPNYLVWKKSPKLWNQTGRWNVFASWAPDHYVNLDQLASILKVLYFPEFLISSFYWKKVWQHISKVIWEKCCLFFGQCRPERTYTHPVKLIKTYTIWWRGLMPDCTEHSVIYCLYRNSTLEYKSSLIITPL
jgi:hypothetical protein